MTKEEVEQKVFDKFTDDFWSILSTYVESINPHIEEKEQEEVVNDVIRRVSIFYSKH